MRKERTLLVLLLALPLLLLTLSLKPLSSPLSILPLYEDPVRRSGVYGERFWVLKTHSQQKYDMILMGDSRVYRGISPQAMSSVLSDLRILNFGYSGGGLNPVMYQAAEQRLDPQSSRPCIVLGITPLTLTAYAEKNEHYLQELNRPADYIFVHRHLLRLLDLFDPLNLNALLSGSLWSASGATSAAPSSTQGYYQEFHDDGWIASWSIPEDPNRTLPSFREIFSKTPVKSELVQSLLDQVRAWSTSGVRVYAFRLPSSPAMLALEDQYSGFDEIAFSQQFEQAGGTWFSIPLAPYHSFDGSHLTKDSALQLSTDLAHWILADFTAP